MPPLLADFIHIKVCKPNLRKTLDTTQSQELSVRAGKNQIKMPLAA